MKKIIKKESGGSAPTSTQSWFQTYGGNFISNQFDKLPNSNQFSNNNTYEASQIRDNISGALLSSGNPWAAAAGAVVGLFNKTGGFSDSSEGLGTWTDIGNTVMSFLLPGSGYFMDKTKKFNISKEAQALQQAYAGTNKELQKTENNSGIKLWFTKTYNNLFNKAQEKNKKLETIGTNTLNDITGMTTMAQAMAQYNKYALAGGRDGYSYKATIGKLGMKIEKVKQISSKLKDDVFKPTSAEDDKAFFDSLVFDETPMFQEGGKVEKKKSRELKELIEYAKQQNPRFIQRMSEPMKDIEFTDVHGNVSRGTHYMADDPDGIVYPTIQEMEDGTLHYFENRDEARERAIKNNNFLKFETSEEANNFAKNYKQGWPDFFGLKEIDGKWYKIDGEDENGKRYIDQEGGLYYFKEGGQMNVIPEGSLHARLHHMENADNLTKKGIPVVDNEGNQQAEVERAEIIFNKEVTDKLEELLKKFNSEEHTAKEKDDFAIEAGKLLSTQIIENTDDRAGLINKVENEQIQSNN